MNKIAAVVLLALGCSAVLMAIPPPVPEIDPASGASALALLSGAVLVFRSRRRR